MRLHAVFLMFAAGLSAGEVNVTLLATTDMHGNIYPYDYLVGKPADRGLAKIATLVKQERRSAPSALLLDCGDTIQGTPLESVYQQYASTGKLPLNLRFAGQPFTADPMMLAMNHLRYDAMAVGNHEFNYGLGNLDRARGEARFPWLSANTRTAAGSPRKPFDAYIVKVVDGVKVAIIGITTPSVPTWEKRENYAGYGFVNGRSATQAAVQELRTRHRPDVIVVIAHSGLDQERRTEPQRPGARPRENMANELALVPGVDVVIFGHTHNQVAEHRIGEVLLTQPKNWAISLARVDLKLEAKPEGGYRLLSKASRIVPVTRDTEADPEILRLTQSYHEMTERYLNTTISQAKTSIDAARSRVEDSAMIDAIHQVQLHYAKADVSFASAFNPRAAIAQGPLTVRQVAALYLYDNELYAIEGTGKMVKDALENAARFYKRCPDPSCTTGPLINRAVIGYNYDMAQGVNYDVDLTRAAGDRIRSLEFQGKPLLPEKKLRLAVNNYRAGGSNGYSMFKAAPVVWRSYETIRDLIVDYYSRNDFPVEADGNWKIIPESARQTLEREASREARALTK